MKMIEVREMSAVELDEKGQELRTEIFNLKFRKATGQLDNTARIRTVRRDLARGWRRKLSPPRRETRPWPTRNAAAARCGAGLW